MKDADIFNMERALGEVVFPNEPISPISIFLDSHKPFYRIALSTALIIPRKMAEAGKCLSKYLNEEGIRFDIENWHKMYVINIAEQELDKLVILYKLKGILY